MISSKALRAGGETILFLVKRTIIEDAYLEKGTEKIKRNSFSCVSCVQSAVKIDPLIFLHSKFRLFDILLAQKIFGK